MRETGMHRDGRLPPKPNREMQIKGLGRKKITEVLDRETGHGKVDLGHGRIEHIVDNTAKNSGLVKTQYK